MLYRASRGHGLHCVTGWRAVSVCEPCESGAGLGMPPAPPPTRRFGCIVPPASTNAEQKYWTMTAPPAPHALRQFAGVIPEGCDLAVPWPMPNIVNSMWAVSFDL